MTAYQLHFITPLFSRGAYQDQPEIRPSSIRGQLHWWFRALNPQNYADEQHIFGSINPTQSSKLVVRVSSIKSTGQLSIDTLPHHKKTENPVPKMAFCEGTTCSIIFSERLGGFKSDELRKKFHDALHAWLLAGTLGLRGTRAAGSFIWQTLSQDRDGFAMPESPEAYQEQLKACFSHTQLKVSLSKICYSTAEETRKDVSNTLGGKKCKSSLVDLKLLNFPFGCIEPQRKTSPLKFRLIKLEKKYYIICIKDTRDHTKCTLEHFKQLESLLKTKKPELYKILTNLYP